jgi:hypothetical protein
MKKYFKLFANIITIGCVAIALAACSKYTPADDSYELPDPVEPEVAYTYTLEVSKPYVWTADGQNYTPVEGSQLNKITVLAEGTPVAYFEIVTEEDATTLVGTHPVKAVNSLEKAFVQGQFMNLLWLNMFDMAIESGSYYLNGETKMFIREGDITITENGGALSIVGSGLKLQDISTQMAFGVLPDLGKVNYPNATYTASALPLSNLLAATATDLAAVSGGALTGYTVTLKFGEAGVTATPNNFGGLDIGGTGKYVSIDFKRGAADLPVGTYNIKADADAAVGDAIAGYYLDLGGFGFNSGCLWVSVEADVPTETFITGGTVIVAENGGVYTVTVNATAKGGEPVNVVYTGPITLQ